jgi:dUTP pyrophosphatase
MELEIKLLNGKAKAPVRQHAFDAGLDVYATDIAFGPLVKNKNTGKYSCEYIEYKTGISVNIPSGYVGLLFPRSSVSKTRLGLANSVGVVDSGYTGEISLRFRDRELLDMEVDENEFAKYSISSFDRAVYKEGDAIGQLVIVPIELPTVSVVSEFSNTEELKTNGRLNGGYGSTGN